MSLKLYVTKDIFEEKEDTLLVPPVDSLICMCTYYIVNLSCLVKKNKTNEASQAIRRSETMSSDVSNVAIQLEEVP